MSMNTCQASYSYSKLFCGYSHYRKIDGGEKILSQPKSKAIRKTFTFTHTDLELIEKIKEKLLDERQVVTDSQVIRMGLASLNQQSNKKLFELVLEAPHLLKKSKLAH